MKAHGSRPARLGRPSLSTVDVDTAVAVAVAVLYLLLSAALLPPREYPRALCGGIAIFALVVAVAWRRGRGRVGGRSVLAVCLASTAVLVVPALGSTQPVAAPLLGFLGAQAAALLWAAFRWTSRPPRARTPLRSAWAAGALAAALLSAVVTIPILLELFAGEARLLLLLVYPGYFAGMLAAATVFWLLQRIAHLAVGRYLIGAVGGTCVYAAIIPGVVLLSGAPADLPMMVMMSMIPGGIAGPALALEW